MFRVNVAVKRLGGGFGGKISRSHQTAAACALAAYHTRRSVMCVYWHYILRVQNNNLTTGEIHEKCLNNFS